MIALITGQLPTAVDVEQFEQALSMLAGRDRDGWLGVDCTTRRKSTIAPRHCGSVAWLPSMRLSGSSSPTICALFVGSERCECLLILVLYRFMRFRRSIAGGEGVGGRAALGAYNTLRQPKLIHIALGLISGLSVEIKTKTRSLNIGIQPAKKERGTA